MEVGLKKITKKRVTDLSIKTILGYFVFFISLFFVPVTQKVYMQIKDGGDNFASSIVSTFSIQSFDGYLVIGETQVDVKIVESTIDREKGLSNTSFLEKNTGMLFVFPENDRHGIWMKDMYYPIDIIWLSDTLQVVYYEDNVSPDTYPRVFKPNIDAKFVLEVPSGFIKENHITKRDQVTVFNK